MSSLNEKLFVQEFERGQRLRRELSALVPVMHLAEAHSEWCEGERLCHVYNSITLMQRQLSGDSTDLETIKASVRKDYCAVYENVYVAFKQEFEKSVKYYDTKKIEKFQSKAAGKYPRGPKRRWYLNRRSSFDKIFKPYRNDLAERSLQIEAMRSSQFEFVEAIKLISEAIESIDAQIERYITIKRENRREKLLILGQLTRIGGLALGAPLPLPLPDC